MGDLGLNSQHVPLPDNEESSSEFERMELFIKDGSEGAANADLELDLSAPPPFRIADIRAAIPKHCWVKSPWRSLSYVLRDVLIIFVLGGAAGYLDSWAIWPLYWAAQGTMFWAIFVLGHDCGHGSFSDNPKLNCIIGHLLHSSILVPYHGWRISHRIHHQNHGHVENDESWVPVRNDACVVSLTLLSVISLSLLVNIFHARGPQAEKTLTEKIYKSLDASARFLRFTVPFPVFAYPLYLVYRSPGKEGSHFNPYSNLFRPSERKDVTVSTLGWTAVAAILFYLSFVIGPTHVFKLYGIPHLIFVMWLDLVTYLHHHGHDDKLPWYRGKEWNYLRGGLTTVDRDYGWFNSIHHDIGTHVIHHLFPQIPHYHLVEATEAAKPVLGKYYREPAKSGPFPFHLIKNLTKSIKHDHYVSDIGDIVYYQTDHEKSD